MAVVAGRAQRTSAGLIALMCLVVDGGCSGSDQDPASSGSPPSTPTPTASAGPSPSAILTPAIACKRRACGVVDKVYYAYYRHPGNASISGVSATAARLVAQLRRLDLERVCPDMSTALTTPFDQVESPVSLHELKVFSGAYTEWATSIGLPRDRPEFLKDPVWCLGHADEYVRASTAQRIEAAPGGFRVWLDVTFENLTERAIRGFRIGGLTIIDPEGLRRLRSYDGHRVNRMGGSSWGGGTDGPVLLPAGMRTRR